jgi:hypothetical protein
MSLDEILRHIQEAGTGAGGFGGTWIGGYHAEQVPEELAPTIEFALGHLEDLSPRPWNYLEIGAAAGGTARLMNDFFHFDRLHIIDDNQLPKHVHRKQNVPQAVEWVGNSHSKECEQAVVDWGMKFDVIFIDGDHSYHGVMADTYLALQCANVPALFIFHDILCCDGVKRWCGELREGELKGLRFLCEHGDRLGLGVFQWM